MLFASMQLAQIRWKCRSRQKPLTQSICKQALHHLKVCAEG